MFCKVKLGAWKWVRLRGFTLHRRLRSPEQRSHSAFSNSTGETPRATVPGSCRCPQQARIRRRQAHRCGDRARCFARWTAPVQPSTQHAARPPPYALAPAPPRSSGWICPSAGPGFACSTPALWQAPPRMLRITPHACPAARYAPVQVPPLSAVAGPSMQACSRITSLSAPPFDELCRKLSLSTRNHV